ncbi:hypothetical protein [Streptomyces inhibens]
MTTHWRHTSTLAAHHPTPTVDPDAIYVRDGQPLHRRRRRRHLGRHRSLSLIEADEGPDLAREVARDLVVFMQRPGGQSQFSVPARTPRPRHDALRALLDEIAADPAADHSRTALAARAGLSPRHLTRLFREHTRRHPRRLRRGRTPGSRPALPRERRDGHRHRPPHRHQLRRIPPPPLPAPPRHPPVRLPRPLPHHHPLTPARTTR